MEEPHDPGGARRKGQPLPTEIEDNSGLGVGNKSQKSIKKNQNKNRKKLEHLTTKTAMEVDAKNSEKGDSTSMMVDECIIATGDGVVMNSESVCSQNMAESELWVVNSKFDQSPLNVSYDVCPINQVIPYTHFDDSNYNNNHSNVSNESVMDDLCNPILPTPSLKSRIDNNLFSEFVLCM